MSMPTSVGSSANVTTNTERILARIRAGLSLGLLDAERIHSLMDSNSGDVEELRRMALSLVAALDLVDDRARSLDVTDPSLIVPREIVTALASQVSTGEAIISEWLDARKSAAVSAIQVGVSQANALGRMTAALERRFAQGDAMEADSGEINIV